MRLLSFILCYLACSFSFAQQHLVEIGTDSTTATIAPIYASSNASNLKVSNQISLFTANEINRFGAISELAWEKANAAGYTQGDAHLRIYLKHTQDTSVNTFAGTFNTCLTGATLVYENLQQNIDTTADWISFPLQQSFSYNGVDNLLILVEFSRTANVTGGDMNWFYSQAVGKAASWAGSTTPPTTSFGNGFARPNTRINFLQTNHDAGVLSLNAPSVPFSQGNHPIDISVANYGSQALSSSTIGWSINGTPQTPFTWTGNQPSQSTLTSLTIGHYTFVAGVKYELAVWTESPNGNTDEYAQNDTLKAEFCTAMAGAYTIGSFGGDFLSFTEAFDALACGGVLGSVYINVVPTSGPYTEQLSIPEIPGASFSNNITINGGPIKEKITFEYTTQEKPYTVQLNGTDHLTLLNLTIENTGFIYGTGIQLTNQADFNTIQNCVIVVDSSSITPNFAGIALAADAPATPGLNGSYNTFTQNIIMGGYYGVSLTEFSQNHKASGNKVSNNQIRFSYEYGIRANYQESCLIEGNDIRMKQVSTNPTSYAVYMGNSDSYTIEKNKIIDATHHGLYLLNSNQSGIVAPSFIINNMISSKSIGNQTPSGIFLFGDNKLINIYHNSVSITTGNGRAMDTGTSTASTGIDIQNNSFACFDGAASYALFTRNPQAITHLDYNNYYTPLSHNFIYVGESLQPNDFIGSMGHNLHSIEGDPAYAHTTNNLHARNAHLNDKGLNTLNVSRDIDNHLRPWAPSTQVDIGADEFTPQINDLALLSLISPISACDLTSSETVAIQVRNYGVDTLTNVDIFYQLNNGTTVQETYTGSIAPGETKAISFSTPVDLSVPYLVYNLQTWIDFPADYHAHNNTIPASNISHRPQLLTAPFLETFDSGVLAAGWENDMDDAGQNWQIRSSGTPTIGTGPANDHTTANGYYVYVEDTGYDNETVNLITPCIDISGLTYPRLCFWYHSKDANGGASSSSENELHIDLLYQGQWINDIIAPIGHVGNQWQEAKIDLFAYSGIVSVRFRVHNNNQAPEHDIAIDDVGVVGVAAADMGIVELISPQPVECGDSLHAVEVMLKNLGAEVQHNIPVTVEIGGDYIGTLSAVYVDSLEADETASLLVGFFNSQLGGNYTFTAYPSLPTDGINENDSLYATRIITAIPNPPTVPNQGRCSPGSLTLQGTTTSGELYWYDSPSSTTPLMIGDTFVTPPLTSTQTYYVEARGELSQQLGAIDNTDGAGGYFYNLSNQQMLFTVHQNCRIDSFTIYPTASGSLSLRLMDTTGTLLQTKIIPVTATSLFQPVTVAVDIPLTPGSYMMDAGPSTMGLYRNTNGANYPYEIPNTISITGNTYSPAYYYYFYNWVVTTPACVSTSRTPVEAAIHAPQSLSLGGDQVSCMPVTLEIGTDFHAPNWSTGETTDSIWVNQTGIYTVSATDINGCTSTDSASIQILLTQEVDLGEDIEECKEATLDAGNFGDSYVWSNGSFDPTITVSNSGTYTVSVNVNGCTSQDTINVTILPSPNVQLGDSINHCGPSPIDATQPNAASYQWTTGETQSSILSSQSGMYGVTVTNAQGCTSTDEVYVNVRPLPSVNLGPDTTACGIYWAEGEGGGQFYNWSTGANTPGIGITQSGTYSLAIISEEGCIGYDTITVTIEHTAPTAAFDYTMTTQDSIAFSSQSTHAANLLWDFGDGTTSTLTNPIHIYAQAGNYTTTLTATNSCGNDMATQSISITALSIDESLKEHIQVYPNPTQGQFSVRTQDIQGEISLSLLDTKGQVVWQQPDSRMQEWAIDVSDIAKGTYFLKFNTDSGTATYKIIIW